MNKSQRSALRLLAVTALVASAVTAVTAQASYIINATETGGDVVLEGSGSIDLGAWSFITTGNNSGGVSGRSTVGVGPVVTTDVYQTPVNFSGPSSIGPGTTFTAPTSAAGDTLRISWSGPFMFVPPGYASEAALAGSATFTGQTFSTLGISSGSYQWTWGSGATADSLTLNVGAVPVPAAVWLFGSGLLGLVGMARRKKVA
jgi:hypothetical protein